MSMTKCKECGNEISTKAETCPKCGAKNVRTSTLTKLFAIFIGLAVFAGIFGNTEQKPAENKEAVAAKKKEDNADTKRFVSATAAADAIKAAVRDPDSLKFESMTVSEDASIVCTTYRAKNGFGGINREFLVFIGSRAHKDSTSWNKNCLSPMKSYMYAVK